MIKNYLLKRIINNNKFDEITIKKIRLGLDIFLINMPKLFIIFILANILGILKYTVIITVIFSIFRTVSFGLHAKNGIMCFVIMSSMFIGGVYISRLLYISEVVYYIWFFIVTCLFYIYAPADTESHPLIDANKRKKLKIRSTKYCLIIFFISYLLEKYIKVLILFSITCQCISILPITYKILKRKWGNYESYEYKKSIKLFSN